MMDGRCPHETVGASYDALAEEYAERLGDELSYKPLDRALLQMMLEAVPGDLPVADLGCGPGHVAGWLAEQGARAVGIDLSAGMVDVATARYQRAEFRRGDLLDLPAADGEFGAALSLYSVIHLEPRERPRAIAEMHRVLVPGGQLLVAVHAGDEVRHVSDMWGTAVELDFHFLDPEALAALLVAAGFTVEATLLRANYPQEVVTRRAYLLARRLP